MGFYKNRKMRFSQRNGMASVRDQIQVDQFDEGTRNAIWNEMLMYLESVRNRSLVINRVRVDVFEFALDSQPVIHKYNSLYRRTSEYRVDLEEWLRDKILRGRGLRSVGCRGVLDRSGSSRRMEMSVS